MGAAPSVDALVRRLIDTPADFLAPPAVGWSGVVSTAAVVSDLLVDLGGVGLDPLGASGFGEIADDDAGRNWLRCVAVTAWLLHDPVFAGRGDEVVADARAFLLAGLGELASLVPADALVTDPDRREELARRALAALGLQPDGETEAQSTDRLAALDSGERARVVAETAAAEQRAAEVREAMHAAAAAEAAAKASRE